MPRAEALPPPSGAVFSLGKTAFGDFTEKKQNDPWRLTCERFYDIMVKY
jgi:hypothetical protein